MLQATKQMREWSAKLLALALKARQDGDDDRSNSLAKMAVLSLNHATAVEEVARRYQADWNGGA